MSPVPEASGPLGRTEAMFPDEVKSHTVETDHLPVRGALWKPQGSLPWLPGRPLGLRRGPRPAGAGLREPSQPLSALSLSSAVNRSAPECSH